MASARLKSLRVPAPATNRTSGRAAILANGAANSSPKPLESGGPDVLPSVTSNDPLTIKLRKLYLAIANEPIPPGIMALLQQIE
jgi:hypothetical protein